MNYFELFDIRPLRLELDSKGLEKKFYELSWSFHPDRNSDPSAIEKSAEINKAYKTLKDSWERSKYFLSMSEKTCPTADDFKKIPPALAEIYFEVQDSGEKSDLERFLLELKGIEKARNDKLVTLFISHDKSPENPDFLKSLKSLVHEHTYALAMQRDLRAKLEHA